MGSPDLMDYFWPAAIAASFFVGLAKGGGLPSIGMLAVPILALVTSPLLAASLLLPIYIGSDCMGLWMYRKTYSAANLRILIPTGILGVALGGVLAAYINDQMIALLIGLMGVIFCLNAGLRGRGVVTAPKKPRSWLGWLCGILTGFTSFIAHAGAPPYQVYVLPQRLPKLILAGTSTWLFAVINAAKIVPYQILRPYSGHALQQALLLIPFAFLGAWFGFYMAKRLQEQWFYALVYASLFLVSLRLLYQALVV